MGKQQKTAVTELLREDKSGKVDYSYLVELKPLVDRICQRFTEGEIKYARLNWRNCRDPLTYKQSAIRHLMQYLAGEKDEDHGVAAIINLLILLDLEINRNHVTLEQHIAHYKANKHA